MADDPNIYEAIGKFSANVTNLGEKVESYEKKTTEEHRKVHDIVVATSEAIRNVARDVAEMKPLTDDYREKRAEARGAARLAGWLYTTAGVVGGGAVFLLGKIADWFSVRPHVIALFALLALTTAALAQHEHKHPAADIPLHEKFYSNWYMPDNPAKSCCNKMDCYPTEIQFRDGAIFAKRREDGKWLRIPPNKVEQHRDNPDGRNHLCAPRPGASYPPDTVFCFALGAGG